MDVKEALKEIPIREISDRLGIPLDRSGKGDCITGHGSEGHQCFSLETGGNYFHCFHCGIAGDVIKLVEIKENIPFQDALRWIAREFKPDLLSQIDRYKGDGKEPPERYINATLYGHIVEHGKKLLYEDTGKEALSYLVNDRGYKVENLKKTEWFYLPYEKEIREYLLQKEPEAKEHIKTLSLYGSKGDSYRLALPYRDRRGVITGFIKRSLNKTGDRWDSTAGTVKADLFNLYACKGKDTLVIVEGYPDALYLPTSGLDNIVAVGQGKLSNAHLEGIKAFGVKTVIIAFDNDPVKIDEKTGEGTYTGIENTEHAIDLLLGTGLNVFVVDPPRMGEHKDPDELVKEYGIDAFKLLIDTPQNAVTWKLNRIISRYDLNNPLAKQKALDESIEFETRIDNLIDRQEYREALRTKFNLDQDALEVYLDNLRKKKEEQIARNTLQTFFQEGLALAKDKGLDEVKKHLDKVTKIRGRLTTKIIRPVTFEDYHKRLQTKKEGLSTGYTELDKYVTIPTEAVTIIAGKPSHGKTTFMINLLVNMLRDNTNSDKSFFFYTYEQTADQIITRIITCLADYVLNQNEPYKNSKLIEGYIRDGETDRNKINKAIEEFKGFTRSNSLFIIDEHYNADDLSETLFYFNDICSIGGVFIDYIQKIKQSGSSYSRQNELQKVSERILQTALELRIPIILGAQLNREVKEYKDVKEDSIREAGDIENDANLILGLWNEDKAKESDKDFTRENPDFPSNLKIKIMKNREGVINQWVDLDFRGATLKITDKGL